MKNFFIYILQCSDKSYYIGHTDDLDNRMGQHQSGLVRGYTAKRLPVTLVFAEAFASRYEALSAERKLKKWTRAKKEALIHGGWEALQGWKNKNKIIDETPKKKNCSPSLALSEERSDESNGL